MLSIKGVGERGGANRYGRTLGGVGRTASTLLTASPNTLVGMAVSSFTCGAKPSTKKEEKEPRGMWRSVSVHDNNRNTYKKTKKRLRSAAAGSVNTKKR